MSSPTAPKYWSPFTNVVNGSPQWKFENHIPSSQIELIKVIEGE